MRKKKTSAPYSRDTRLDTLADELSQLPIKQSLCRIGQRDFRHPEYIPPEVLVTLFRRLWLKKERPLATDVFAQAVVKELEHRVHVWAKKFVWLNSYYHGIRADPENAIWAICEGAFTKFMEKAPRLIFPECHFSDFLEARGLDYVDTVNAKQRDCVRPFSEEIGTREEADSSERKQLDAAEFFAALRDTRTPQHTAEEMQHFQPALDALQNHCSEEEQRAILLHHVLGYEWESSKTNKESVASEMGIDADQARYLANRGLKKMRGVLK